MDWRKPPEGATWISLIRNWKGKWSPFAFGTDEADCLRRTDRQMPLFASAGAAFFGKHLEPFDPTRNYDDYTPEKPLWTRTLPSEKKNPGGA